MPDISGFLWQRMDRLLDAVLRHALGQISFGCRLTLLDQRNVIVSWLIM
jgi:hypothetical protein